MNIVNTQLNLLNTWIREYEDEEKKVPKEIDDILSNLALFAMIWAIGGAVDETTRSSLHEVINALINVGNFQNFVSFFIFFILKFNFFFHITFQGSPELIQTYKLQLDIKRTYEPRILNIKLPDKATVFDIVYDIKKNAWVNWTQTVEKYIVPKEGEFHDIFVPTVDSIRNNFFLHRCVQSDNHLLICGPTGTGKTVNVIN